MTLHPSAVCEPGSKIFSQVSPRSPRNHWLAAGTEPGVTADLLALLAYGVNLRSRAGADAGSLRATVGAALRSLTSRTAE
ncbi:hypothetical protein [Streptomyces sp. NPDC003710]